MAPHALDFAAFWPRLLWGAIAGLLTWVVALDHGMAIVDRLAPVRGSVARLGVGGALGYSLVGSAVGILGLFRAIHPLALELLLGLALLVRIPYWALKRGGIGRLFQHSPEEPGATLPTRRDLVDAFALAVAIAAFLTALVAAALPAVWWDPIAYHLPIVAAALAKGAFTFTPTMVQSGFPSLGEAAALPAYAIAGSAGAAMVTLGSGVCLTALVAALAARIASGSGATAAMLLASSPLWLWLAPTFYVDVPFAMLVLAGLVMVMGCAGEGGLKAPALDDRSAGYAVAGWLCGAAAAVKYSGLGACAILLVTTLLVAKSRRGRSGLAFVLGAAAVALGWYLRTFIATGDPLYPFLSTYLSHDPAVTAFAARYVDMTRNWCGGGNSASDLLVLPYRLLTGPRDFCGDPGMALRAGIVFAIASSVALRSALAIALITLALTIAWFFASQQWRFALAPVSTYVALVASGTTVLGTRLRALYVAALCVVGAFSVALNWLPSGRAQAANSIVPAFAYISGRQSAAQYLDDRLETFAAAQWLAKTLHPGDRVLALDDVRDYYFPPGTMWGNPFYQQAISVDWLASAASRYAALRALGVRFIVVNANDAYIHRTPTGVAWEVLAADAHSVLREVFRANDTIVYEIVAPVPKLAPAHG